MSIHQHSPDHQMAAQELRDAFLAHDQQRLTELTDEQFDRQADARRAFYDYVDQLWEDAKHRGLNPALRPDWTIVAAMRDLAIYLQTNTATEMRRRDDLTRP